MTRTLISANNLVKQFDHFTAVDRINFEIKEGECFGFLGPNGAGKTSTMRMIYCFSPVTSGALTVLGDDVRRFPARIKRQMGVVPQDNNLDPDLSVYENLIIYARYFSIPKVESLNRVNELLKFLQLEEKKNAKITSLSGGMKRRLVIARALINKPKILVLDEPTTGLDPQVRHLIWEKLRALKKSGVTMVLTTHYMDEAAQLCDRLVIMNEGKILSEGSPTHLVHQHVGKEVYEIRGPKKILEALKKVLGEKGFQVEEVGDTLFIFVLDRSQIDEEFLSLIRELDFRHRMASLEDVFLRMTGRELRD